MESENLFEADSRIRKGRKVSLDAETIGLFPPQMFIKPSKLMGEAYLIKKLNDA